MEKGRSSTTTEDSLCESERLRLSSSSPDSLEHFQRSTGLSYRYNMIEVSLETERTKTRRTRRKEKEEKRKTHVQQLLQDLIRHSRRYAADEQRCLSAEFLLLNWGRDGRKVGRSRRRTSSEARGREVWESSWSSWSWPS